MFLSLLALAGGAATQSLQMAAGQSAQYLGSNPGGAIPAMLQAPSTSGFMKPTIQPSRGGLAVCVSSTIPIQASTSKNIAFNYSIPQNQSQVTQAFISMVSGGSTFAQSIMTGMQSVNGTYNISATYCTPANNTKPTTVEILTHGVGFNRYLSLHIPRIGYHAHSHV